MAEITLVRHGQASFGTDHYDRLSPLGHQQALWLGQHFKQLDQRFDRVVLGTMQRHEETARGVLSGLAIELPLETHIGLNEYDFQGLLTPFKQQYPHQWQSTDHARSDYYHNMKLALSYWMSGDIESDGQDTWQSFCTRIRTGFEFAYHSTVNDKTKRTLLVSSGGVIAVVLTQILKLDSKQTCNLTLQIKNSSCSKLLYRRPTQSLDDFTLDSFNAVTHLQSPERQKNITFS